MDCHPVAYTRYLCTPKGVRNIEVPLYVIMYLCTSVVMPLSAIAYKSGSTLISNVYIVLDMFVTVYAWTALSKGLLIMHIIRMRATSIANPFWLVWSDLWSLVSGYKINFFISQLLWHTLQCRNFITIISHTPHKMEETYFMHIWWRHC